jgi:hypothetical protein
LEEDDGGGGQACAGVGAADICGRAGGELPACSTFTTMLLDEVFAVAPKHSGLSCRTSNGMLHTAGPARSGANARSGPPAILTSLMHAHLSELNESYVAQQLSLGGTVHSYKKDCIMDRHCSVSVLFPATTETATSAAAIRTRSSM